jgi:predicted nucleic acid-binding protein
MDYGAISLDTSIFDQKGLKLESGILKTLEQFNGKPSHLVISEIVVREVHAHLKKKATESRAQAIKAIRESMLSLSVSKESSEIATKALIPADNDNEVAKNRITSFIKNTGAEVIPATGRVELDDIIKKYFKSEPPFAETGKKKNEFPDAIALMSLESWAKENETKILAVAKDGDWEKFAEQSEYIDVVEDLAEAIAKFQPHSSAIDFCSIIAEKLPNSEPEDLHKAIAQYLSDAVGEMDLYPEASSQFSYEPDYVEVVLNDFEFITGDDGHALLQPVQGQNETLIVEAKINITATASTSFSLSVRDSIDKDYVSIGSASASTDLDFESEILLTFEGDFDDDIDNIELTDFELLSYPSDADFGDVEPDWWHDDE